MQGLLLQSNDIEPERTQSCNGLGSFTPLAEGGVAIEYSVTVWRTPIGEWKEVLYRLTYRREWLPERSCWRDVVVRQERL